MKISYLLPLFLVVLATTAIAATLDVSMNPTEAAPGSDLKLTVKTSGVPNDKWFVAYDIALGGGCVRKENSQNTISDFMLDEVSADQTKNYNIKAPSADGSCSVNVAYTFTGESEKTATATAAIKTPEAAPPAETTPPPAETTPPAEEEATGMPTSGIVIVVAIIIVGLIIFLVMKKKKK